MSAKISMMLSSLPQFQNFSKCEVDGTPSNEQEFLASVRMYKRDPTKSESSVLIPSADWGFTYADFLAQEPVLQARAMFELRKKRNDLLVETDKITMMCYSRSIPVPADWSAYQQELRDLPTNSSPDFADNGTLIGVNWPTVPSTKP